jgi:hypothetical protein
MTPTCSSTNIDIEMKTNVKKVTFPQIDCRGRDFQDEDVQLREEALDGSCSVRNSLASHG